jgi:Spy/CpxP family protein refolding chaperone
MKNKILICTLATAFAVAGFTATKASAADNSAPVPVRAKMLQRVADKLNLTPEQRAQIRGILAGEKNTLKPLLGRLHEARVNLRAAIRASDANESAVRAASAGLAGAEADLAVERMKLYGKIAPVLTDEQRQKISGLEQRADGVVDNAIAGIGPGLDD